MLQAPDDQGRLNSYALVTYIPVPMGWFLDDLRRRLVPVCKPHAHVTVLPPRPLNGSSAQAVAEVESLSAGFPAFAIEVGQVEIFPVSNVVYLEIGAGREQLLRMHKALNSGAVANQEPFVYHPHITLAQDISREEADRLADVARRRWQDFSERRFFADTLFFVQAKLDLTWIDVARCPLSHPVAPELTRTD